MLIHLSLILSYRLSLINLVALSSSLHYIFNAPIISDFFTAKVNNINIFAFSYFFDRATDLSLIGINKFIFIHLDNLINCIQLF